MDFAFDLTQGLFSSAGVDVGTQLLLKVLSGMLDADARAGRPPLGKVLDAGCGVGVIGICAAAALAAMDPPAGYAVRCQDRDELARLFTLHNAAKNRKAFGRTPPTLEAHTEPLLAGPRDVRWDMILTNIPAKAGTPVLEDFVRRSVDLLAPGGRVVAVVVNTLADFLRGQIALAGAELLSEQQGSGHSVLAYAAGERRDAAPVDAGPGFLSRHPFYVRTAACCKIVDTDIRMETVHGASGFDEPGDAVAVAAKLACRMGPGEFAGDGGAPLLVHEPGQGFFPCWLLEFIRGDVGPGEMPRLVLSGRNILALEAARHNVSRMAARDGTADSTVVPAADLRLGRQALLEAADGKRYAGIAAFPELLPQSSLPKGTDQLAALWDALLPLLAPGGVFLAAFASSEAERFDRKKPAGFARLGGIKRNGFRALAYRHF